MGGCPKAARHIPKPVKRILYQKKPQVMKIAGNRERLCQFISIASLAQTVMWRVTYVVAEVKETPLVPPSGYL